VTSDIREDLIAAIDATLAQSPAPGTSIRADAYIDVLLDLRLVVEYDRLLADLDTEFTTPGEARSRNRVGARK
jgi:hypothetical protein